MKYKLGKIMLMSICTFALLSGCSKVKDKWMESGQNAIKCEVVIEDAIKISYDDETYVVLQEIVNKNQIGTMIGYVQDIYSLENGATVSIMNIYCSKDETCLLADVNGSYRKLVLESENQNKVYMPVIETAELDETSVSANPIIINSKNGKEIIVAQKRYQVTEKQVAETELGTYLNCIAQSVTFDANTGEVLSNEELKEMDWDGTKSTDQQRETWMYSNVYARNGVDIGQELIVQINGVYKVAEVVK